MGSDIDNASQKVDLRKLTLNELPAIIQTNPADHWVRAKKLPRKSVGVQETIPGPFSSPGVIDP